MDGQLMFETVNEEGIDGEDPHRISGSRLIN